MWTEGECADVAKYVKELERELAAHKEVSSFVVTNANAKAMRLEIRAEGGTIRMLITAPNCDESALAKVLGKNLSGVMKGYTMTAVKHGQSVLPGKPAALEGDGT